MLIRKSTRVDWMSTEITGRDGRSPKDDLVLMINEIVPSIRMQVFLSLRIELKEQLGALREFNVILSDGDAGDKVCVLEGLACHWVPRVAIGNDR
jgi:hypothetical protein